MKSNKLAIIALFLWSVTIAVFGWFFIHGNTTSDERTVVLLQINERNQVLSEMRGLLSATQEVLQGANQGDMPLVIKSATAAGMAGAADINPILIAKLPIAFKTLGMSVHHDMDEIARAAQDGKSQQEILQMASNTLLKCVACHSVWQLKTQ